MAKRDWLSREHRLRVAELAINWLNGNEINFDAHKFGSACCIIERYLIDGPRETVALHQEEPAIIFTLEKADG